MRKSATILLSISLVWIFHTTALAATFIDDMNDMDQNQIKTYHALIPFLPHATSSQLAPFPDKTAFVLPQGTSMGWAQYQIQGAKQIKVSIYSRPGTFVSEVLPEPGSYALGVYEMTPQALAKRGGQASFCPTTQAVYTRAGGRLQKLYASREWYRFVDTQDSPSDLIGYGVNVYASADGERFTRISLQPLNLYTHPNLSFCYEEYAGNLPASARFVRVEVNDFTQLQLYGSQKVLTKTAVGMTCLASVVFAGDVLTLGVPEPEVTVPVPPLPSIPEEENPKVKSKTVEELETLPNAGSAGNLSSSKFEGVIVQLPPAESKSQKSSTPPQTKSSDSSKDSTEEPTSSSSLSQQEVRVYEVPRSTDSNDGFTSGVIAYIVIIIGAILLVALLPKKQ